MQCKICNKKAIYDGFCQEHFLEAFEQKVKQTIEEFSLVAPDEKVVVAASGGKDSLTTLYLLKKLGYQVEALAIDEGIHGYREHTLADLRRFCDQYAIPLRIVRFVDEFGITLDEITQRLNLIPCTPCGILRRYLLNKYSKHYDKIATGHNLDDEVQAFVMNMMKNSLALVAKQGPITGIQQQAGFTPRIKPLIRCTEKEVRIYAFLKGFTLQFTECVYVQESFRNKVRDWLNALEQEHPGTKQQLLENLFLLLPTLKKHYQKQAVPLQQCTRCGEPTTGTLCAACLLRQQLDEVKKK